MAGHVSSSYNCKHDLLSVSSVFLLKLLFSGPLFPPLSLTLSHLYFGLGQQHSTCLPTGVSVSLCCPVPVFFLRRHTLGASANQHAVLTTPLPTHFSTDSLSTSVVWGSPRAPCSLCWIPSLMIFWSSLQLLHYSVILWTSLSGLAYCIWVCRFFENKLTINCSTWLENDQIIIEKE